MFSALGEHEWVPSLPQLLERVGCDLSGPVAVGGDGDGDKHFLDSRIGWRRGEVERWLLAEEDASGGGLDLGGGCDHVPDRPALHVADRMVAVATMGRRSDAGYRPGRELEQDPLRCEGRHVVALVDDDVSVAHEITEVAPGRTRERHAIQRLRARCVCALGSFAVLCSSRCAIDSRFLRTCSSTRIMVFCSPRFTPARRRR
jgi:hypothetical protein